jgi:hypothetical protein
VGAEKLLANTGVKFIRMKKVARMFNSASEIQLSLFKLAAMSSTRHVARLSYMNRTCFVGGKQ